jgi:Rad3-related DNA helicase
MATPLSTDAPVLALVSTLGLGRQYEREYGYFFLPGRQEHPCVHAEKLAEWHPVVPTAFDCHYSPMNKCPYIEKCPYHVAKETAIHSRKVVLTYKYASIATWPKMRKGILICDEAHGVAEEILDIGKFEIQQYHVDHYGVPPIADAFPYAVQGVVSSSDMRKVIDYIAACWRTTAHYDTNDAKNSKGRRFHKSLEGLLQGGLEETEEWFIDAGPNAAYHYHKGRKRHMPALVLRPLTAKNVAGALWSRKQMTVLMSATIGDPYPLAKELGISHFQHRVVPHVVPVDKRPVVSVFKDRMTKANLDKHPGLYVAQAKAISHYINTEIPPEWRGIILTTSYKKIEMLRTHLDIGDRLWEPPKEMNGNWEGVSRRIQAFLEDPREGIVACDTLSGWGHGIDLRGDLGRFAVVAGVQFPNPSDPYDQARRSRSAKYLTWLAHSGTMQASGRVSRGEVDENGEYLLNVAMIADGSALTKTAMRAYSPWFVEAMR